MRILSEERYKHIVCAAGRTYRELMKVEAELEEEKRARALAQAMAEGFMALAESQEKETYKYKSLYEREKRRNERLKNQNGKLYQSVVALSVGGEKNESDL